MKAYGYIRVSGQGQVEGDGLVRQEQAIREYAEQHDITIEKVYREEGVSGTLEHRPALAEMMVSLEQNGHDITTVVIEKVDRLARDLMVQEAIINDFQKHGFELISVHEGPDLLSDDPTRKLVRQVMGAIAEYDKSMIVMKLRAARDRKRAREGKCEGRKTYQETMPDVIALIKQLRRKPKGQQRMTHKQVAEELNRRGYKTRLGREFNEQVVKDILRP
jgi:DNA invertase Pin-like site-specific DNA recombinase